MNDNTPMTESEARLLAALRAVQPERDKPTLDIMRASEREDVAHGEIYRADLLPAVLGWMKGGTLTLLAMTAFVLLIALQFRNSLGAPIILALMMLVGMACKVMLIVEQMERTFGRWHFTRRFRYTFVPAKR